MAKVTLKDIAREVGVSATTVSLVLNGRPVRVSAAKRAAILECARRKNYVPNQIARSLVTRHSGTLGLIVPNIESRFFSSLAKNLEGRCRRAGYALFITNSDGVASVDAELVGLLVNRGVDGVFIVCASDLQADADLLDVLESLPVPYVMVDRRIEGARGDCARYDSRLGGEMATSYLLERGHRRVAIVANMRSNTGLERVCGYERALGAYGISVDKGLELASDYYITDAYRVADRLMATGASAVVATSDNIALGLLRRLFELDVSVPADLSVVSYDNSSADALITPALTSIEQDVGELSDAAIEMMLRRVEGRDGDEAAQAPQERVLTPRLVEKNSVRHL